MAKIEKRPLESKKFIAYLISETTWKAVLLASLFTIKSDLADASAWSWWFMVIVVFVAGFVETIFIGGQAYVDLYVRMAVATVSSNAPSLPEHSDKETTIGDKQDG